MKLLLTGAFNYSKEQLKELEKNHQLFFLQNEKDKLTFDAIQIEAVVCNGLFLHHDIKKFKNLKIIQLTSAGIDRVPIDYINEKKIKLFNAGDIYSIPVAEWAISKILEIYKKSYYFYKSKEKKEWKKERDVLELTDKTVAIIGYGNIGNEIAKRLKPFGVNIIGVGILATESDLLDEYFFINDIEKVLNKSDIIILTLPLSEQTKHFFNKEKIKMMKDKGVLINVSRGQIIDEKALIEAIEKNKFLGVALDVFGDEPLDKKSKLWNYDNVIITPHNAFISDKVDERMFEVIKKNLGWE